MGHPIIEEHRTNSAEFFDEKIFRDAIRHGWKITVFPQNDWGQLVPPDHFLCSEWAGISFTTTMFGMTFDVDTHVLDEHVRRTGQYKKMVVGKMRKPITEEPKETELKSE